MEDPGDCITVDMSVSSEKIDLLTDLARTFNSSDEAEVDGRCVFVRPQSKASGGATQLLASHWDEQIEGPRPVIWSPASSAWGGILNQQLADQGKAAMVGEGSPFMLTPLVIAMPEPMAEALGWPDTPIGFEEILALARSDEGWAAFGHPEWGPFRLGKTNPNFSTSGLSALIAQTYAATGKARGLSPEDLRAPETVEFATDVESAVVHYGDITLTFLNNLYRADQRGAPFSYASAVAVEEVSVVNYNLGNPDGVLQPGEEPRPPRVPLVAIYPKEGTLFSDNPFFVLDAEWVDDQEAAGAALFEQYVQRPENQQRVLEFGFRPGNPEVAIGAPISLANGVDPDQPQNLLPVPEPDVMVEMLEQWGTQRKGASVMLLLDVSGSMGDTADPETGSTKLDLAKRAVIASLGDFKDRDLVGVRVFTTDLGGDGRADYLDLVPLGPVAGQREAIRERVDALFPQNGTPLYTAVHAAYDDLFSEYDPERINAIVVLSDGVNDDGDVSDDEEQLSELLVALRRSSEGQASRPVRVFPIAYGADADLTTLRLIADSADAAVYSASDPRTINKVFTAVISNF